MGVARLCGYMIICAAVVIMSHRFASGHFDLFLENAVKGAALGAMAFAGASAKRRHAAAKVA